jgi:hypothetical protein
MQVIYHTAQVCDKISAYPLYPTIDQGFVENLTVPDVIILSSQPTPPQTQANIECSRHYVYSQS